MWKWIPFLRCSTTSLGVSSNGGRGFCPVRLPNVATLSGAGRKPRQRQSGENYKVARQRRGKGNQMKKYYVSGNEWETLEEAVEAVLEEIDEDAFDDFLHDEFGWNIDICDVDFDPVEVLKEMSSYDYDCKYDEWKDDIRDKIEDEIDSMCAGDTDFLYGIKVEVYDDEEEDEEEAPAHSLLTETVHTVEDEMEFDISEAMHAQGEIAAMLANIPSVYVNRDELNKQLSELYDRLQNLAIGIHTIKERSS